MSKVGQYNLDLQKQANELGYSTVQEALDNGYEVLVDTLIKVDSTDALAEQEKAHEVWLKEKEEVITELEDVARITLEAELSSEVREKIAHAIKFIEEGEI